MNVLCGTTEKLIQVIPIKITRNDPGQELISYLRPDAKSQVTIEYSETNQPIKIDNIVISTQHDEFDNEDTMREVITNDIKLIKSLGRCGVD